MSWKAVVAAGPRGGRVFILAALLAALGGLCGGCADGGDKEARVPSPDRKYVLVATVNQSKADMSTYGRVKLTVLDAAGRVDFQKQTRASGSLLWQIGWGPNDRIWLTCGDVGVLCWERQEDGSWPAVRGSYKGSARHGKWEWLNDDGSVNKVRWFLDDAEVTEEEFLSRLLDDEKHPG
ncbi:MAG: hypothetical protein GWP05_04835 [Anaerolineaceae bacterium]|nr:hypothetical protein [Anaerolineaceae bacterium]